MSDKTPETVLSPLHYQALAGLALGTMFLVQMQQQYIHSVMNVFVVSIGVAGILYRIRLSPLFVFLGMASGHLLEQYYQNQWFNPDFRSFRMLDVADVLLCMGTVIYLIAHYRLHGLWYPVVPLDPAVSPPPRSVKTMTPDELMWLVIPMPVFAIAAEFCVFFLRRQWAVVEMPPRWKQLLAIAWVILLVMFLAAHFFRYWRRSQMDRATALLLLQDVLWNETRGEQRRVNRWIVWRKLKQQEEND